MSHISVEQRKDMKHKDIYKINKEFPQLEKIFVANYPIQTIYKRYRNDIGRPNIYQSTNI